MTASASCIAVVEQIKPLKKYIQNYDSRYADFFSKKPIHVFMERLRNVLLHLRLVSANLEITTSQEGSKTDFNFYKSELKKTKWIEKEEAAKTFLSNCNDKISVSELLEVYSRKLNELWTSIEKDIEKKDLNDFQSCRRYVRRHTARLQYNLLLYTWLNNRFNPYDYLHKFFTKSEIKDILSRRTPEARADRAIEIYDEENICNEELRNLLYRLFRKPIHGKLIRRIFRTISKNYRKQKRKETVK